MRPSPPTACDSRSSSSSPGARRAAPVLLTHGTFSNGNVVTRLAAYLANYGFPCWVLELRGHGASEGRDRRTIFEDFGRLDVPAAVEAVRLRAQTDRLFYVGHSGGGLAFLMYLARNPQAAGRAQGVVTLASQATGAGLGWRGLATITGIAAANSLGSRARSRLLRLGPEGEFRGVVNQWFRWNLTRRWRGRDRINYLSALASVRTPALCLAGVGDRYIAPVKGCVRLFAALGAADKRLVICGRRHGFSEDYDHARIVASRGARQEVWPKILEWLQQRCEASPGI
ncbi:MAG: alpha/beta fold hydrolase [Candidatus Rokubacteria bacterium]|nr:alpha/beta fold hydrolase [Candidatus Rokubacteria bacterium]